MNYDYIFLNCRPLSLYIWSKKKYQKKLWELRSVSFTTVTMYMKEEGRAKNKIKTSNSGQISTTALPLVICNYLKLLLVQFAWNVRQFKGKGILYLMPFASVSILFIIWNTNLLSAAPPTSIAIKETYVPLQGPIYFYIKIYPYWIIGFSVKAEQTELIPNLIY